MKSLVWFVLGLAGGFVVAHLVNKDPRGHELLAQVDARIGEFTDRMSDAYREQEARIGGAFSDIAEQAKDAAATAARTASDAVSDTADAVTDAARKLAD